MRRKFSDNKYRGGVKVRLFTANLLHSHRKGVDCDVGVLDKEELPIWQRIKYDIELKIITGEYEEGDKVPSVRVLAKMYGIGTSTSQTILERMLLDGTLIMERGIGFKVDGRAKKRLAQEHENRVRETLKQICEYCDKLNLDPLEIVKDFYAAKDDDKN